CVAHIHRYDGGVERGALIVTGAWLEERSRTCLATSKALETRADRLRAKSDERVRAFWALWQQHEASPRGKTRPVADAPSDAHQAQADAKKTLRHKRVSLLADPE